MGTGLSMGRELGCGRDSLSWTEQVPKNPGGPGRVCFEVPPTLPCRGHCLKWWLALFLPFNLLFKAHNCLQELSNGLNIRLLVL